MPVSPPRIAPISNLPERNLFFTGREDVLAQLQKALAGQRRAALSGLGGVGKTETALEYAHQHFDEYDYTFWTTANSREALLSGYVSMAGLLKLPLSDARDQTLAVDAVKRWLTSNLCWLLILDNADDLGMAREFIPPGKNGHLLLTTRAWAVGPLARFVEIQKMGTEEAMLFLLRRARYIAEDASLDAATEADQATAEEITEQLGGLPLALDQAASYIEETGCGLSDYLKLYRHRAPELLGRRGALAPGHSAPVASTWALSFKNIEQANPAAAELLRFCAFMHPNGIPEEVLSEGAPELGPILGPVGKDAFALNGAISAILKYSLLWRDPYTHTLEIHRLVQAALKQGMDEITRRSWAERAVYAVNRTFPEVEFSTWAGCERLLPQAHACAELINQLSFEFPDAAQLLKKAGVYLYERGRYADAGRLYEQALAIREKTLGPEHHHVANSLNHLAVLHDKQGQYTKAEPLYQRALAIREKALGPEHPGVAASLNNLAVHYKTQGKHAKAEPLYERALAIFEKALGPEHTDVATCLNNLAELYRAQGQYGKARPLYERALAIHEKAVSSEHPDVATYLNNLAELHRAQGQYGEAEALYQRALVIWEKAQVSEHPEVATSLENYAGLLRDMGRPDEAAPLESRARAIREKPR